MAGVKCVLIFTIACLLISSGAFAAQINSITYKQNVIISYGGENSSSDSYRTSVAVGIINMIINSTSYINKLGFFHILLLADGQPCTADGQCEGGYCCSSSCSSSACTTPSPGSSGGTSAGSGGGGAGGGGPIISETKKPAENPKIKDFSVNPESVKEHLALGTAKNISLKIKNTGDLPLVLGLRADGISDFIFFSENGFTLEPGREKNIEITIIGKKLGSYLGQIEISSGEIKKSISAIVEVESESVLFDAKMDILPQYSQVEPGGELKAQITLLNVGTSKKVDVTTTYIIKDSHGDIIFESSDTFAVDKQSSFVKSFRLPKDIKPGDYLAVTELRYEKSFAVSSQLFSVVPKNQLIDAAINSKRFIYFAFAIIGGLLFLFVYRLASQLNLFRKSK